MNNLDIYNKLRTVPKEAQKPISGGRLNGKTDINPMWRIKALTEQFGVVGFGWKYKIIEKRLEHGANDEIATFVDIELFVKVNSEWSEAIPGTGGSSFVAKEAKGLFVSDECFKMALTDAISVACKALGVGADIYWDKDSTKYDKPSTEGDKPQGTIIDSKDCKCDDCENIITATSKKTVEELLENSQKYYKKNLCSKCGYARYKKDHPAA